MSITDYIVLSAGLFGSVYLCSTTLTLINMTYIEKKRPSELIVLNGLTFIMTGSLVIYTFEVLRKLKQYK